MEWFVTVGLVSFLVLSILSGMRIAFCLALIGSLTLYLEGGIEAFGDLGYDCWGSVNSFLLLAVPLFIFMGNIIIRSGVAGRLYSDLTAWLYNFPGRLLVTNIVSCSIFAAVSGSSLASAATMGQIAIPAQRAKGYKPSYIYGSVAAGGTLGILIPPSVNLIIYGSITGASVAKLFIAGIVPGVILAALFVLFIVLYSKLRVDMAPPTTERYHWHDRLCALKSLIPIGILVIIVLGSIYTGKATPTEAASVGTIGAILIALGHRMLSWGSFKDSFLAAARTTSWLYFLVIGANVLAYAFGRAGITQQLASSVTGLGLSYTGTLIGLALMYLALGCIIDPISMMLLTMPIVYPILQTIGCDMIWFGIFLVLLSETGLLTPPVGLNLYIIQGVAKSPLAEVVRGAFPYVIILLVALAIIMVFPSLALWLPSLMTF